jgi:hypothetical protein
MVKAWSPVITNRVMPAADTDDSVLADVPELMVSVSTPEVVNVEPAAVPLSDTVAASAVPATAAVA